MSTPRPIRSLVAEWRNRAKQMPNAHGSIIGSRADQLEALLDDWDAAINGIPDYIRFEQTLDYVRQTVLGERKP